eukprot:15459021-Alexandrium_andersonii.AAC.1
MGWSGGSSPAHGPSGSSSCGGGTTAGSRGTPSALSESLPGSDSSPSKKVVDPVQPEGPGDASRFERQSSS